MTPAPMTAEECKIVSDAIEAIVRMQVEDSVSNGDTDEAIRTVAAIAVQVIRRGVVADAPSDVEPRPEMSEIERLIAAGPPAGGRP